MTDRQTSISLANWNRTLVFCLPWSLSKGRPANRNVVATTGLPLDGFEDWMFLVYCATIQKWNLKLLVASNIPRLLLAAQALGSYRGFVKFMGRDCGASERALPQYVCKMERSERQKFIGTKRLVLANGNLKSNVTLTYNHEQTPIRNLYQ